MNNRYLKFLANSAKYAYASSAQVYKHVCS